jgi:hypothetical protein
MMTRPNEIWPFPLVILGRVKYSLSPTESSACGRRAGPIPNADTVYELNVVGDGSQGNSRIAFVGRTDVAQMIEDFGELPVGLRSSCPVVY